MGAGGFDRLEIPWSRPKAIGSGSQGTHGTDLHSVAGEVRRERQVREGVDLRVVSPFLELDEWIAGDLVGKAGASSTQNASLPVEQHQIRNRDRLGVVALLLDETGFTGPIRHGLVLQWTLTAPITNRTIERVIDEEEFEDALLGFLHSVVQGVDHHAVGDRVRTRSDE